MKIGDATVLWRFSVLCPDADRVFLVKDCIDGATRWIEMQRAGHGQWVLTEPMAPGRYRFRYFAVEGNTYFNCGDANLIAEPLDGRNIGNVQVDHPDYAQPA